MNLCDDCDVGGLSPSQWAARKSQIEASEPSYPSAQHNIALLKPLMPANGRFWVLIPTETEYGSESTLVTNARDMYNGARAEPMVIGLIGFVWTNAILCPPADCTQVFATKQLPSLLSEMKCIGQAITKPGSPTSC